MDLKIMAFAIVVNFKILTVLIEENSSSHSALNKQI